MSAADSATFVGHATVRVDLDGTRLITDPVLRRRVGPLARHGSPPAPEVTEGIDAVLISHLHHDHADLGSLRRLGRDVPMVVPPGSAGFFRRHGFRAARELAPGESAQLGALTVTAVEANHGGGRRLFARRSRAVGYLLGGSRRVYFAGDTDVFEGMEDLGTDLDLALLPVWGWGPTIGEGHLDPEAAARAAALIAPRLAVPIHWGTLYPFGLRRFHADPLRLPAGAFAEHLRELAPQVETRVLSPGESVSLS